MAARKRMPRAPSPIRWKPSELGCHRPSPSSQSWTSMSMPITMGGSSSARCVFLLLLFVPNGDPQLDSCHHSVGRRFCHHCATRMSKYRMVADAIDRGPMIQCSCLSSRAVRQGRQPLGGGAGSGLWQNVLARRGDTGGRPRALTLWSFVSPEDR